ncbi:MAG: AraC family transcriptional regulator [Fibrobacteres bacterium]|nr:AraC family transcriptional regulator [Fibrobacterota bacterium]
MLGLEHDYHFRFVLIVNLRTVGSVVVDKRSFELQPGETLLIFPNQFHHYHSVRSESICWLFVTFECSSHEGLATLRNRIHRMSDACLGYLEHLVARYAEQVGTSPGSAVKKDGGASMNILMGLVLLDLMKQDGRSGSRAGAMRPSIIDQITLYVWDNFDKDLKRSDLKEKFPYSESHLRMLFRKRMGMSLGAYIQKVRMNRAQSLLVGSSLSVSEAGLLCGYASLHSFSRAFKKMLGLSPLAYKNLNAGKY